MTITLQEKIEYGNRRLYPCDEKAGYVTAMTRRKTLSDKDVEMLKNLGHTIIIYSNGKTLDK